MAARTWNSGGSTDMNDGANYTGAGALLVTDDLTFDGTSVVNATATGALSVATITVAVGYTGTFNDGGKAFTIAGAVSITPGGTFTASGTWTQTGDANFVLADSGTYSVVAMNVVLQGTGTFTIAKIATRVNNITCAAAGKTTTFALFNGNADCGWQGTLTLGGGTWAHNTTCMWYGVGASVTPIVVGASTTSGSGGIYFYSAHAGAVTISVPVVTTTGNYRLRKYAGNAECVFSLDGDIAVASLLIHNLANLASAFLVFNTNNHAITCSVDFSWGQCVANGTTTLNMGSSVVACATYGATVYNAAAIQTLNMDSSQWTCTGAWTFQSNHTIVPGTSVVNFTGNSSTLTGAGKALHNVVVNKTAGQTLTIASGVTYDGYWKQTCGLIKHTGGTMAWENVLFPASAGTLLWASGGSGTVKNCTFLAGTTGFLSDNAGSTYDLTDCIMDGCTKGIDVDAGTITHDYNNLHCTTPVEGTALGANETIVDPQLGNLPAGCIIDTANCPHADGYALGNLALDHTGSDTFDNLGIDESVSTMTGYEYAGTDVVAPGIYYIVTRFHGGGTNRICIGGGDPNANAATIVDVFTAANTATRTGTRRIRVDANGDVDIDGDVDIQDTLIIGSIADGAGDFLTEVAGLVKLRTAAETLGDIGAAAAAHLHDGDTLQNDGINSDGGAFAFTTTGTITVVQDLSFDADNMGVIFGDGQDSKIYDDGSDLMVDFDLANAGGRTYQILANGTPVGAWDEENFGGDVALIVGSNTAVVPYAGWAQGPTLVLRQATGGAGSPSPTIILSDNETDATLAPVGNILFCNEAIAAANKRLTTIYCNTYDQTDRGIFGIITYRDGVGYYAMEAYYQYVWFGADQNMLYSSVAGLSLLSGRHLYIQDDNAYTYYGAGNDCAAYYNGTDLIIDPDIVGTGIVLIGATGDNYLQAARLGTGRSPTFDVDVYKAAGAVTNAGILVTHAGTAYRAFTSWTGDAAALEAYANCSASVVGTNFGLAAGNVAVLVATGASAMGIGTADAVALILGTTDTERMRIAAGGNVSIGGLAVGDSLLHVWGGSAGAVAAVAGTILTVEGSGDALVSVIAGTDDKSGFVLAGDEDNDAYCAFVDYSIATPEYQVRAGGLAGSLLYSLTLSGISTDYGESRFQGGPWTFNYAHGTQDIFFFGDVTTTAIMDSGEHALYLGDTIAASAKYGRLRSQQYDTAGEPEGFTMAYAYAYENLGTEYNLLYLGGADANANCCTTGYLYAAADELTRTGVELVSWTATEVVINSPLNMVNFRVAGSYASHMLLVDSSSAEHDDIALCAVGAPNWQGMGLGIFIGNCTSAPSGNPASGGFLYVDSGALKYRGSSGTVTTIAAD